MRKRIIAVLMLAAVCLPLCGCNLIDGNVKTMLRAPQPNNMQEQLTIAITETLGSNLTYVSPKNGKTNLRQPIILTDLDSDGKDEVVILQAGEQRGDGRSVYRRIQGAGGRALAAVEEYPGRERRNRLY